MDVWGPFLILSTPPTLRLVLLRHHPELRRSQTNGEFFFTLQLLRDLAVFQYCLDTCIFCRKYYFGEVAVCLALQKEQHFGNVKCMYQVGSFNILFDAALSSQPQLFNTMNFMQWFTEI